MNCFSRKKKNKKREEKRARRMEDERCSLRLRLFTHSLTSLSGSSYCISSCRWNNVLPHTSCALQCVHKMCVCVCVLLSVCPLLSLRSSDPSLSSHLLPSPFSLSMRPDSFSLSLHALPCCCLAMIARQTELFCLTKRVREGRTSCKRVHSRSNLQQQQQQHQWRELLDGESRSKV